VHTIVEPPGTWADPGVGRALVGSASASAGAGREAAGRKADPDTLRASRSVLVTKTDAEAEDYLGDLMPGHPKLSAHPSAATSRERR
jgi:hypothetical protein